LLERYKDYLIVALAIPDREDTTKYFSVASGREEIDHGNNITDHPNTFAHRHLSDMAVQLWVGYYPSGGLGLVLVIIIILLLMGRI